MNKEEWAMQDKSPGAKVYVIGSGGVPVEYQIESTIACGATVYRKFTEEATDRKFQPFQALISQAAYEAWKDKRRKAGLLFDKTCVVCGKHFETLIRTATTCSIECAYKKRTEEQKGSRKKGKTIHLEGSMRHGHWKRTCIVCGKEFIAKNASTKICSDECRKFRTRERNRKWKQDHKEERHE